MIWRCKNIYPRQTSHDDDVDEEEDGDYSIGRYSPDKVAITSGLFCALFGPTNTRYIDIINLVTAVLAIF